MLHCHDVSLAISPFLTFVYSETLQGEQLQFQLLFLQLVHSLSVHSFLVERAVACFRALGRARTAAAAPTPQAMRISAHTGTLCTW